MVFTFISLRREALVTSILATLIFNLFLKHSLKEKQSKVQQIYIHVERRFLVSALLCSLSAPLLLYWTAIVWGNLHHMSASPAPPNYWQLTMAITSNWQQLPNQTKQTNYNKLHNTVNTNKTLRIQSKIETHSLILTHVHRQRGFSFLSWRRHWDGNNTVDVISDTCAFPKS